jgi:tRNA(fMet)-specific endonuclease VapC
MFLLDTDVLIDIQRKHLPAIAWFQQQQTLPIVPGFVVMELIQAARNQIEVQNAIQLTKPFQIVWPTAADCQIALQLFTQYHLTGGIGMIDALIAACTLANNGTLLTFNFKHYKAIPQLQYTKPYIR